MKTSSTTLRLTRGAVIAALYAVLSYATQSFQFLFFQFRLSEALCILPVFFPEAIPGLYIGCLVSNIISGCNPWDTVFGSLATLIGAVGAYLLRRVGHKMAFLTTLPTVLANAFISPFVIIYAYGASDGYWFLFMTVAVGEIVTATLLGTLFYYAVRKTKLF